MPVTTAVAVGLRNQLAFGGVKKMTFQSIQPAIRAQISFQYKVNTGGNVYINWGYGSDIKLVADGTNKTVVSNFPTANTTYDITLRGDIDKITRFYIYDNSTVVISSVELKKLKGLTDLFLFLTASDNGRLTINSLDLVGMPLTKLTLKIINNSSRFYTEDLVGMPLTELTMQSAPANSNIRINSSHLAGMNLTVVGLSANAAVWNFNTVDVATKSISSFGVAGYGSTSDIRTQDMVTWPLTFLQIHGGFTGAHVNTSYLSGITTLTQLNIGHTGPNTVYNTEDLKNLNLTSSSVYCDIGGVYTIDLTDYTNMSTLTTLYINAATVQTAISNGKLSDLPTQLQTLFINNVTGLDITTGTMKAWQDATITLTNSHPSASVDAFLIAWAPVAGTATKTITLKNQRTSASDAAVSVLQSKSKTIVTSN